ncbi:MAG: GNAT family N-acetyltransferase [Erysipelothrix sp.]|nr:GNAT family N-acetyltransferase [Erysipelothrix sp.]
MDKYKVPVLETERLILRAIELDDAKDMYAYASDPVVAKYTLFGAHASLEDTQEVIKNVFLTRPSQGKPEGYVIVDKETNTMIGTCDFWPLEKPGVFEMGYALNRNYWGKGIMSEAGNAMLEFAFDTYGVEVMSLKHHVDNPASGAVAIRLGFRKIGVKTLGTFTAEGDADAAIYELTKERYNEKRTSTKI